MTSKERKDVFDVTLAPEEQKIEEALPELFSDLSMTANAEEEAAFARAAAANYLRKNAKINIRRSEHDVEGLKRIAAKEG